MLVCPNTSIREYKILKIILSRRNDGGMIFVNPFGVEINENDGFERENE